MRNPQGYLIVTGPAGVEAESDSFTCAHCQKIIMVKARCDPADMGGLCNLCGKLVCPRCAGGGCTPWEKQMEKAEARDAALRSYGF